MRQGNAEAATRQRDGQDREPALTVRQPIARERPAWHRSRQRRQTGSRSTLCKARGANAMQLKRAVPYARDGTASGKVNEAAKNY